MEKRLSAYQEFNNWKNRQIFLMVISEKKWPVLLQIVQSQIDSGLNLLTDFILHQ
jgi:hypothetical protein